jgi:hypothetical protein
LHFVLGVCKQQQMPTQLSKILGDAMVLSSPSENKLSNFIDIIKMVKRKYIPFTL